MEHNVAHFETLEGTDTRGEKNDPKCTEHKKSKNECLLISVGAERAHLFGNWFKELGQLGSRLLRAARVVSQLHGLNTAKLREQFFDNTLKHRQQYGRGLEPRVKHLFEFCLFFPSEFLL